MNAAVSEATTSSKSINKNAEESVIEPTSKEKLELTSQTTRDIEIEIAKNTANYEEKQKSEVQPPVVGVVVKKKVLKTVVTPLQPFQVMRFLRMLAIVVLGVITGYRSAISNMEEVLTFNQEQNNIRQSDAIGESTLFLFMVSVYF